ncbi:Serine--tRNA ligase/mitochondrial [Phytophthora rubi]|uniref:serine--tRNA ligase n=1 Tax=Phytophthora rubi TaxID=129364 RepID=A0A6A3K6D0_9STRA|nr:Serine--tRNA ligase/mitochondrial [Phytophthora rubi]KAE9319220.1 Serine--tRNA ligase/mitochondrial [Phytophthora rubi]
MLPIRSASMLARACRSRASLEARRTAPVSFFSSGSIATTAALGSDDAEVSSNLHGHVKARLDYKKLVENVDAAIDNGRKRFSEGDPQLVADLYQRQAKLRHSANLLRAERNAHAKQLGQAAAARKTQGAEAHEAFEALRLRGQELKREIADVEGELAQVSTQLELEALKIPNDTHPDVPVGAEEDSRVVLTHGEKPVFGFKPKDHYDLATDLELLDTQTAARVAGSKFTYLCNEGAMMEIALVHWTLSKLRARGFKIMFPPDVAHYKLVEGCGFQPRGEATQIYSIANSDLCLTATSEITLAAMKSNEILPTPTLPLKYAGFSHCFRTEIGHGGRLTRGIYRIHQFSKVEMFAFCANDTQAQQFFDEMVDIQTSMYAELGLHYELVDMATGDLGAPAYRKFDLLAWMPGREEYGEVSSMSMCTDYQARRLNIRHKDPKDEEAGTSFVHTLNGTACAVPRLLISLWETYQQEDGSIVIPEVLRPYMGGQEVIRRPE